MIISKYDNNDKIVNDDINKNKFLNYLIDD